MNKKQLIAVIVFVVVVLVVVGVFAFHDRAKAPVAPNPAATSTDVTVPASSTGSPTVAVVISTSTKRSYANSSFSLSYPASWTIAAYSPFSITTFGNKYSAGGILPPGGAVITVVTTTIEQGYLPSIMSTQLMGGTNIATTTLMLDGVACPAAAFQAVYATGATSRNVSVYCERGSELFEIYLSYGASDPARPVHVSDFNNLLDSIKFLP